jgi:hypothetical protein
MWATPALRDFIVTHPKSSRVKTGEDLVIAATAITRSAAIVTFNVRDYLRIDRCFPVPGIFDARQLEWSVRPDWLPRPTLRECLGLHPDRPFA